MAKYHLENSETLKIFLIIDNAVTGAPSTGNLHHIIKVVFLPPNTSSSIPLIDEGNTLGCCTHNPVRMLAYTVSTKDWEDTGTVMEGLHHHICI